MVRATKGNGHILLFCVRDRIGSADKPVEGVSWQEPDKKGCKLGKWYVCATLPDGRKETSVRVTDDMDRNAAYQHAEARLYNIQEVLPVVPRPLRGSIV